MLLEIIAAVLVLANIILVAFRSLWNYLFALLAVSVYAYIFFDAKLYSDAGLQVFFFAVNLYGWWAWSRNKVESGTIIVERLTASGMAFWVLGSIIAILGWGTIMARVTDASYPYWDAAVAMLSVAAQILMTRRYIENWHWWIFVNAISIPLYLKKDLLLTAAIYALLLATAIWGLLKWRRAAQATS